MNTVFNGVYINGAWRAGHDRLEVINPATEASLAHVSVGDANAVSDAVDAASAAFVDWSKSTGRERATLLRKVAQGVGAQREHLMQLQSSNNGKPLFEAAIDVDDVIATFTYYAGLAELFRGNTAEGERLMFETLRVRPDFAPALARLGWSSWRRGGRFADAIRYGEQALRIDPEPEWIRSLLGRWYLELGEVE